MFPVSPVVHIPLTPASGLLSLQTNAIFELQIKNKEGVEATWTIDVKNEPQVYKGAANPKSDVTLIMTDETFQALAGGKVGRRRSNSAFDVGKTNGSPCFGGSLMERRLL